MILTENNGIIFEKYVFKLLIYYVEPLTVHSAKI